MSASGTNCPSAEIDALYGDDLERAETEAKRDARGGWLRGAGSVAPERLVGTLFFRGLLWDSRIQPPRLWPPIGTRPQRSCSIPCFAREERHREYANMLARMAANGTAVTRSFSGAVLHGETESGYTPAGRVLLP